MRMDTACLRDRPAFDRFSSRVTAVVENRAIRALRADLFNVFTVVLLVFRKRC